MNKQVQDRRGKILVFGSLAAVLVLAVTGAVMVMTLPPIGPNGCIVGRVASGYTAIVVDMTDPLTEDQCAALIARIRRLAASELAPEMLSLWALGDFADGTLHPILCLCDPGEKVNPFAESQKLARARRDSLFARPLEQAIHSLRETRTAPRSPILEGVEEVTELRDFVEAAGPERIVLASDLLQNSAAFSSYRQGNNLSPLARSMVFQSLKGRLTGVAVDILYVPRRRDAALQGAELRAFWRRALQLCGATRVTFERL